jgi:uncharacterized protein (TIGR02611 family)
MTDVRRTSKRFAIGLLGGIVLAVGIIAIPYPGPGWLIVFAGLGILATEFEWAGRLLAQARARYDAWQSWIKRQTPQIRFLFLLVTTAVVILTIYLLNGYGILAKLIGIEAEWVKSPLFS